MRKQLDLVALYKRFRRRSLPADVCSLPLSGMAICHDPEGWQAVSRIREFDTTLCFEEGIILSVILGGLLVSAAWRSLSLCLLSSKSRSSKSHWLLAIKLVSAPYVLYKTMLTYDGLLGPSGRVVYW